MQGHISSWLELIDSTSIRDIKKVTEALNKLVVKDDDFDCANFAFNIETHKLIRYTAFYWESHPPDYSKLLRRTSRRLWPGEWLLFEEKRAITFCDDRSTLRVILVAKDTVYVIDGDKLGAALRNTMTSGNDPDVGNF